MAGERLVVNRQGELVRQVGEGQEYELQEGEQFVDAGNALSDNVQARNRAELDMEAAQAQLEQLQEHVGQHQQAQARHQERRAPKAETARSGHSGKHNTSHRGVENPDAEKSE